MDRNIGPTNVRVPWLKNYAVPKFSDTSRKRSMMFLNDFEQYIKGINFRVYDFHFVIQSCSEGTAREWWSLARDNMSDDAVSF